MLIPRKPLTEAILGLVFCILTIGASVAAYVRWHTVVLEYRDVIHLHAVEFHVSGMTVARITGLSGLSAYSLKKITAEREDSSMVILVYLAFARRGTTGSFEYDVSVPDAINEVRFGKQKILIRKRETQQQN